MKRDGEYKKFSEKLTPETRYPVIGVRVPELRAIAKEAALKREYSFLDEKHVYFEEFFLHGLIIAYAPLPKKEKTQASARIFARYRQLGDMRLRGFFFQNFQGG